MSREMGYYELKLIMMNERKKLTETSLSDVTMALEDLAHARQSPGMILDGLQNEIYSDGPLRAQLSLFRQDRAAEGATEGAIASRASKRAPTLNMLKVRIVKKISL